MQPQAVLNSLKSVLDAFQGELQAHQVQALKAAIEWATANDFTEGFVARTSAKIVRVEHARIRRGRRERFVESSNTWESVDDEVGDDE